MENIKAASLQILGTMTRLQFKAPTLTKDAWQQMMILTEKIEESAMEMKNEASRMKEANKKLLIKNAALSNEGFNLRQQLKEMKSMLNDSQLKCSNALEELHQVMNSTDNIVIASQPIAQSTPPKKEDEPGTSNDDDTSSSPIM